MQRTNHKAFMLQLDAYKAYIPLGDFVRATRRETKTRIRLRDWLTLAGEKIRREQVGTVPTFLSVRANKFAKWKIGLNVEVCCDLYVATNMYAGCTFFCDNILTLNSVQPNACVIILALQFLFA